MTTKFLALTWIIGATPVLFVGEMTAQDWLLIIGAISTALVAIVTAVGKILIDWRAQGKATASKVDQLWTGTMNRGYLEAKSCKHLFYVGGKWSASEAAHALYEEVKPQLVSVLDDLRISLDREPTKGEFGFAAQKDNELEQWMLDHACPTIGLHHYGCYAIAHVIALEASPK